jgi:mannose-6-phosphate isomerase-like protein (cupin superfamily)
MIKRKEDIDIKVMHDFNGGGGEVIMHRLIETPEELYNKGRLFNYGVLNKDCGVGWHVHEGDGEFYYILSGEGEFNDNGTVYTVYAGDLLFTGDGEGHSLVNKKDEPLEMIALVVYK